MIIVSTIMSTHFCNCSLHCLDNCLRCGPCKPITSPLEFSHKHQDQNYLIKYIDPKLFISDGERSFGTTVRNHDIRGNVPIKVITMDVFVFKLRQLAENKLNVNIVFEFEVIENSLDLTMIVKDLLGTNDIRYTCNCVMDQCESQIIQLEKKNVALEKTIVDLTTTQITPDAITWFRTLGCAFDSTTTAKVALDGNLPVLQSMLST